MYSRCIIKKNSKSELNKCYIKLFFCRKLNPGSTLAVPKISLERRRSSCTKLPVSPLSVQTRIAASSSRVNLNQLSNSAPSNVNENKPSPSKSASNGDHLMEKPDIQISYNECESFVISSDNTRKSDFNQAITNNTSVSGVNTQSINDTDINDIVVNEVPKNSENKLNQNESI